MCAIIRKKGMSCLLAVFVIGVTVIGNGVFSVAAVVAIPVRIPVSCSGADCTAVLYNADGMELYRLKLEADRETSFEVFCRGFDDFQYLVKLEEEDSEGRHYDRTVYRVIVTTGHGANDDPCYVITAFREDTEREENVGKVSVLSFTNSLIPSRPAPSRSDSSPKSDSQNQSKEDRTNTVSSPSEKSAVSAQSGKPGSKQSVLPQTGSLLLWLAPWMALAGTGMIAGGIRLRRKSESRKA